MLNTVIPPQNKTNSKTEEKRSWVSKNDTFLTNFLFLYSILLIVCLLDAIKSCFSKIQKGTNKVDNIGY